MIFWSINFFTANSKIIIMKWSRISSWLITQVGGDWRQLDGLKMQWRLPGEGQRLRKSFLSRTALCDLTRKIKSDGKFNYDWIAIPIDSSREFYRQITKSNSRFPVNQGFWQSLYFSQTCNLQVEFVYILSAKSRQTTQLVGCKFD